MDFGHTLTDCIGFTPPRRTEGFRVNLSRVVTNQACLCLCCTEGVEFFLAQFYTPCIEQQLLYSFKWAPVISALAKVEEIIGVFAFQNPENFLDVFCPSHLAGVANPKILQTISNLALTSTTIKNVMLLHSKCVALTPFQSTAQSFHLV